MISERTMGGCDLRRGEKIVKLGYFYKFSGASEFGRILEVAIVISDPVVALLMLEGEGRVQDIGWQGRKWVTTGGQGYYILKGKLSTDCGCQVCADESEDFEEFEENFKPLRYLSRSVIITKNCDLN